MVENDSEIGVEQGTPDGMGSPIKTPGADGISQRVMDFFWLVDCSGSMDGRKIDSLNAAIRECIPAIRQTRDAEPSKPPVMMRAISFSSGAQWHIAKASDVATFQWTDLKDASGVTDLGKALELLAPELAADKLPAHGLRPVILLVSDGKPTDDWRKGLQALLAQPGGEKAVRAAVGISGGSGDEPDMDVLHEFMGGHNELKPLLADNAVDLVRFMKWLSTSLVKTSSTGSRDKKAAANVVVAQGQPKPTPHNQLKPGKVF